MLVIADTSPLNYLAWIDAVEILPQLYGKVVIPPEVRAELLATDAPVVVRSWAGNFRVGWRSVPRIRFCATILAGGFSISAGGQR